MSRDHVAVYTRACAREERARAHLQMRALDLLLCNLPFGRERSLRLQVAHTDRAAHARRERRQKVEAAGGRGCIVALGHLWQCANWPVAPPGRANLGRVRACRGR
eukprot:2998480-Prymnesium_polylepis.1